MRAKAVHTIRVDAYKAGLELGEGLASLRPEVVFLFPSIDYQGSPDLLEGLYDGLQDDSVLVIGNTGDGFYANTCALEIGASALGIHGEGSITWSLHHATGVGAAPRETVERCMAEVREHDPALVFFALDFRTDASEIETALQDSLHVPTVGGSSGDAYQLERCFQYANRTVLTDSIVALAIGGPGLAFAIRTAHSLHEVGEEAVVDAAEGTEIYSIDGKPAMHWLIDQMGRPFAEYDMGVVCVSLRDGADEVTRLRSLMPGPDRGANVSLYGHIRPGTTVRCCVADSRELVADVRELGRKLPDLDFTPRAAVVVSCAGRKRALAGEIDHEVQALAESGQPIALAGFPSFGEFGPVQRADGTYSRTLFHNMTYIALVLGDR